MFMLGMSLPTFRKVSHVDALKSKILSIVDTNGGKVARSVVREALDVKERRQLLKALEMLKQEGLAKAQSRAVVDANGNVTDIVKEIVRIPAPLPLSGGNN